MGRPSAVHLPNPPSSTATLSKPLASSSHHSRVAQNTFAAYTTTAVSGPMPSRPAAAANRSGDGLVNQPPSGSERSSMMSANAAPGMWAAR